ncbi:MAG TPA: hypothetical protein VGC51_06765 [Hansschlegelia sp.]
MLFAIVMNVCLQADAVQRRQERIEIAGRALACLVNGQPAVVEWGQDHPGWIVKSWKCRPA